MPAREREQESGAQKYKGAAIPSKTFRYLQIMTQDEEQDNNRNQSVVISSNNPMTEKYEIRSEAVIKKSNLIVNCQNNALRLDLKQYHNHLSLIQNQL